MLNEKVEAGTIVYSENGQEYEAVSWYDGHTLIVRAVYEDASEERLLGTPIGMAVDGRLFSAPPVAKYNEEIRRLRAETDTQRELLAALTKKYQKTEEAINQIIVDAQKKLKEIT